MALNLEEKKAIVADVSAYARDAQSLVIADYRGLSVAQMTQLRNTSRQAGVIMRVVRNTLARLAVAGTRFECVQDSLEGPVFLAFSTQEPSCGARIIREFIKKNKALTVRALSIDGQLMPASDLEKLASMPTRDEAIAQLMSVMVAPITQCARTFSELYARVVRVAGCVRDQKQSVQ